MKKDRKHKEKFIGRIKIIDDFLPKPKDLVLIRHNLERKIYIKTNSPS
jgi:hypothetical protein